VKGVLALQYFGSIVLLLLMASGCEKQSDLSPVPEADVTILEPGVRSRISDARTEFEKAIKSNNSSTTKARAYGDLAMVYHAQDLTIPAKVAYLNALRLDPREKQWPYLLAQLYADKGDVSDAIKYFEIVLGLDPAYWPVQIYLGQMYLLEGDLNKAALSFEKAKQNSATRAAALAGLGKVALVGGLYKEAAANLEEALRLAPNASRLRQPLALAYRGLGEAGKAQATLARFSSSGAEPGFPDPIVDQLSDKVAVSRVLLRRGQRLGQEGRFDLAEVAFRAAVASDPTNTEALTNLGIALANIGKSGEAQKTLAESLRMDDTSAIAHLSLGVVYDRMGEDENAIAQYRSAMEHDPRNLQAVVYLADATMRTGAPLDAAHLYSQALSLQPKSSRIELSLAFALIKARDYSKAKEVLETAVSQAPKDAELNNTMARLLATAPIAEVRDGKRALAIATSLFTSSPNLEVGQTYAMALAESENFADAVKVQQEILSGYEKSDSRADKTFLLGNLDAYLRSEPVREGWSPEDLSFHPRSPAAARAK
jgi:tetratricopeptide (TPR) repeat protein